MPVEEVTRYLAWCEDCDEAAGPQARATHAEADGDMERHDHYVHGAERLGPVTPPPTSGAER